MPNPIVNRRTGGAAASDVAMDSAVLAWAARVVANGAAYPSDATILTASAFVTSLKGSGVWSKLHMINLCAPDSAIAMKTPLLVGGGIDPWSDTGVQAGNFTVNGIQGQAGKFINCFDGSTSLISNTIASPNSASMTIYVYQSSLVSAFDWGLQDAASNGIICNSEFSGITAAQAYVANTAAPATWATGGANNGYYCASRTTSTRVDLFFANSGNAHSSVANDTTANAKTLSTLHSMPIGTLNNNGDTSSFQTTRTYSFFALGDGLTLGDSGNLYSAIQTLRASFGGGFR